MRRRIALCSLAASILIAFAIWLWPRPRAHVLLVTLDTTRADRLGCYGYSQARTPVLDSLAAAGVLCQRAYTVAPLTLPAHASLFTGLYPAENGIRTNGRGRLDTGIPTLAEVLERQGYDTGAFVASFVLNGKFGLDRGFKTYDDDFAGEEQATDALHRQRRGEAVVDAALAWLGEKRARPFFCWVHLYDPHSPYLAHDDLFGDEFADRPYDAEIAYVDRQVGRLVDFLSSHGLETRTLLVVVGDHGEGLGEHVEKAHGMTLYNATMHVPLLVRQPGKLPAGGRVSANVSLVDLSPTILDLLGMSDPRKISGRSFQSALAGGPVAKDPLAKNQVQQSLCYGATDDPFLARGCSPLRSLTAEGWKYIRTTRPELYDLANDPHERRNLAESEPDQLRELEGRLEEFEARLVSRAQAEVQLSAAERRALASLGYAQGAQAVPHDAHPTDLPDIKDILPLDVAVEDAEQLARQGSEAGFARLREIILEAPGYSGAYLSLANALRDKSEFDEAAAVYGALVALKPLSRDGHYGLGIVLVELGRLEEALAEFSKALEIDPELFEARFHLAKALASTGRDEAALAQLDAVLQFDHRYSAAYQWRAAVLTNLGRSRAAISDYRRALEYAPDSAAGHYNLGMLLVNEGDLDQARRHLNRAAELSPENADMRYALGALLARSGQYEEALEQLAAALALKPDHAGADELLRKLKEMRR